MDHRACLLHLVASQCIALRYGMQMVAMRPITRAGYNDYFVATPETIFSMQKDGGHYSRKIGVAAE